MGEDSELEKNQTYAPSTLNLREVLEDALGIFGSLGAAFNSDSRKLLDLRERLDEGRFHLAVLGQFKRGKSTFLNALLGEQLLPTSVLPLTMIPSFIKSGQVRRAVIYYEEENKKPDEMQINEVEQLNAYLQKFVTEVENPKNRLGVSQVEISHPADILGNGVVLIDTPGIGSTFKHNTEATLNFLPQCDAALFLVSADPPITETEVKFLKEVRTKVPRLFFVLNKIDYLSREDKDKSLEFFRKVLAEQVGIDADIPVFCVSAQKGLEAKGMKNFQGWIGSGMEAAERYLVGFLASKKIDALQDAVALKSRDIITDCLMRVNLTINSLKMPLADMEKKMAIFESNLTETQQDRISFGDIIRGERNRIVESLYEYAQPLKKKARAYLENAVIEHAAEAEMPLDENTAQEALDEAIPGFCEHEAGQMRTVFDRRATDFLKKQQEKVNSLAESIRKTAAQLFDISYQPLQHPAVIPSMRQLHWITQKWDTSVLSISSDLLEKFLPKDIREKRTHKKIKSRINDLVNYNIGKMRLEVQENIEKAFSAFARNLDSAVQEIISSIKTALEIAIKKKKEQSETIADDVRKLESAASKLADIESRFVRDGAYAKR
ncbi:MAG: dynamin family protein [Sedimentisphaerales bacterium]